MESDSHTPKPEPRTRKLTIADVQLPVAALELIDAERARQLAQGYDPARDQQWKNGELVRAAECYLKAFRKRLLLNEPDSPKHWPWPATKWKPSPKDHVREWVIAGALFRAEAERLEYCGSDGTAARNRLAKIAKQIDRRRKWGVVWNQNSPGPRHGIGRRKGKGPNDRSPTQSRLDGN